MYALCTGIQSQTTYSTGSGSGPSSVAVGDFNNDQRLDIVVANHGTSRVLTASQDPLTRAIITGNDKALRLPNIGTFVTSVGGSAAEPSPDGAASGVAAAVTVGTWAIVSRVKNDGIHDSPFSGVVRH